jgi:uncharacterized damage-inducible protein DinB
MTTAQLRPALNGSSRGCPPAPVAAAAMTLLDQCSAFVRSIPPTAFVAESRTVRGGTIGKHIRHTLDHFRACLDSAEPGSVADYDQRERDVPMESDPAAAVAAIAGLLARLGAVGDAELATPVRVRVMLTCDGARAELTSTLGRELAFATHHAVHHHAMLAAIAAEFGVRPDPAFGKAPSTICHERRSC